MGTLFLGLLASCSKSEPPQNQSPPKQSATPPKQSGGLKLDNLWLMKNGSSAIWIVELENGDSKPIKAFMAKCSIVDDLDNVVASKIIEYTSETKYSSNTNESLAAGHSIVSGEHICIQSMAVAGLSQEEADAMKTMGLGTAAYNKEQIAAYAFMGMLEHSQEERDRAQKALEQNRVTKKIVFEIEKIVNAE